MKNLKQTSNLTLGNYRSSTSLSSASNISSLHPSILSPLNPWYITGFSDGESCFSLDIKKKIKTGWRVEARFQICLHEKDRALLEMIRAYFGGIGNITKQENFVHYQVFAQKDISIIIAHFDKYKLITNKLIDYILFKQAFDLSQRTSHSRRFS